MSAGKGDAPRPYNVAAYNENFMRIFRGNADLPDFKPQAESQLPKADEPQKCEICEALDSSIPI